MQEVGVELDTFCLWSRHDDHYTTKPLRYYTCKISKFVSSTRRRANQLYQWALPASPFKNNTQPASISAETVLQFMFICYPRLTRSKESADLLSGHYTKSQVEVKESIDKIIEDHPLFVDICFEHNHKLACADYVKHKKVSKQTRKYFEDKFHIGKFPAEAVRDRRRDIKEVSFSTFLL